MEINLTLLNHYLVHYKCPVQIYIDTETDATGPVLKFLRGEDENGSRVEFLSYVQIDDIFKLNGTIQKIIAERDVPESELLLRSKDKQDKTQNIADIKYGLLAKYIVQLFAAGTGILIYPELQFLPSHKKSHFATIFNDQ